MKTYYIYYLLCPITDQIKYVGCTKNPKTRYRQHIKKLDKQLTPKRLWLESLFKKGLLPKLEIVSKFDNPETAREAEQAHLNMNIETALNIHNPKKGVKSNKWSHTG